MKIEQAWSPVYRAARRGAGFLCLLGWSLFLAGGCGGQADESSTARNPIQDLMTWQRDALAAPSQPVSAEPVHRFYTLRQDLLSPATRATAEPTLLRLLELDPDNLLWIEAALLRQRYLDDPARLDSLMTARIAADSTGAVAQYIQARRGWGRVDGAEQGFFRALDHGEDLDPVSRAWLQLRGASVASWQGDQREALRRLEQALPGAWEAGGLAMATCVWFEISRVTCRIGWLDAGLEAARLALECAERDGFEIGMIRAHVALSEVYEARAEFGLAWDALRPAAAIARDGGHPRWQQDVARRFTMLLKSQGNERAAMESGVELLDMSLAMSDTAAAIAACVGLATFRLSVGEPAAARSWLAEAEALTTARFRPSFSGRLATLHWRLAMETAHYGRADSILSSAAELGYRDRRMLLMESMEIGLEHGKPLLVREALRRLRTDPSLLVSDGGYDPRRDVSLLAAMFQARQGDFQAAYEEIETNARLTQGGAPVQAQWAHHDTKGRIAELEGDDGLAIACYETALELAEGMENTKLADRSRIRLGEALIRQGRPGVARGMFRESLDAADYWSRLAAGLVTGCALAAEGDHRRALDWFSDVADDLGEAGPAELRQRVVLETARSLHALGRDDEAARLLGQTPHDEVHTWPAVESEVHHAFFRPLAMEWTELEIVTRILAADDPDGASVALETLAAAEAVRWRIDPAATEPTADSLAGVRLQPGSPVLVLFDGPTRMFVWVGTDRGWRVRELADPEALASLMRRVAADAADPAAEADLAAFAELGRRLLGPVLPEWSPGRALHLIAPGRFASVPWPALIIDADGGADRVSIARGPIIRLAALQGWSPPRTAGTPASDLLALGFDDESSPGALRFAGREARAVADSWPRGRGVALVGDEATWAALSERSAGRFAVIHIASHGIVRTDLAAQPVLWLAGAGADTGIDADQIRSLSLSADLVFLSCCEGGRLARERGLGLDSLARAFLQAGARHVIASGAVLEDRAALEFAADFYGFWNEGLSPAAALAAAQHVRARREDGLIHPFNWANYQIHRAGIDGS